MSRLQVLCVSLDCPSLWTNIGLSDGSCHILSGKSFVHVSVAQPVRKFIVYVSVTRSGGAVVRRLRRYPR